LVRSPCYIGLAIDRLRRKRSRNTPGIDGVIISDINPFQDCKKLLASLNYKWVDDYKSLGLRRVYIPKAYGRKRPLGIPTIKDRIIQDLYSMFLDPIVEANSDPNSFGFRKGRSPHYALGAIARRLIQKEKSGRSE
jgi:RNA-directed DNA polymerase